MGRVWYTTLERVMRAADVKANAYLSSELSQAIETASDAVDSLCRRGDDIRPAFAPWTGTITYDWPVQNNNDAYRFYLNQNSLYSLTTLESAGTDITADALLWPETGPPYTAVDIDQGSSSILDFVSGSGQRSLAFTGIWTAAPIAERVRSSWTLGANLASDATTATLNAPIGTGSIVRIGTERMVVTARTWADSGQTGTLTASTSAETLTVSDGSAFLAGEELLLDAERVLVRDVAGNDLIVKRAVSGSTLAAHTTAAIYWARSCEVERAALGTTAAAHGAGDAVAIYVAPGLVEQLTVAYALDQRQQEVSAYSRTIGSGDGERAASARGIGDLEKRVMAKYGRPLRYRAVGA